MKRKKDSWSEAPSGSFVLSFWLNGIRSLFGRLWTNLNVCTNKRIRDLDRHKRNIHFHYKSSQWHHQAACPKARWWSKTGWHLNVRIQGSLHDNKEDQWRTVLPGKERLSFQHLCKDASGAPDINRNVVLLPCEHNFRGAVVACGNVACHLRVLDAREAKITDLFWQD